MPLIYLEHYYPTQFLFLANSKLKFICETVKYNPYELGIHFYLEPLTGPVIILTQRNTAKVI